MAFDFTALNSDPGFQALSYSDQVGVRANLFRDHVASDPKFQALAPQDQNQVMNAVVYAPPAFQDAGFSQEVQTLGDQARAGSPDALKFMSNAIIRDAFFKQATLLNLFDKTLVEPIRKAAEGDSSVQQGLSMVDLNTAPNPARKKALEYFNLMVDQNQAMASRTRTWGTIAGIGGAVLDTAVMYGLGAGTMTAPRGLAKLAMSWSLRAADRALPRLSAYTVRALGGFTHAAVGGTIGIARENLKNLLNGDVVKDPNFQTLLAKNAVYFKDYFLGDMLFNFAAGLVWPFSRSLFRTFTKGGGNMKPYFQLSDSELQLLLKNGITGVNMDSALLGRQPPEVQQTLNAAKASFETMRHVEDLTPEGAFQMLALHNNFAANLENGKWNLLHIPSGKTAQLSSIDTAQKWMIKILEPSFSDLKPVDVATLGGGVAKIEVAQTVKKAVAPGSEGNVNLLTNMIAPYKGNFEPRQIEGFAKMFARANGATGDDIAKLVAKPLANGKIQLNMGEETLTEVSSRTLTPKSEIANVTRLVRKLSEKFPGKGKGRELGGTFLGGYGPSLAQQNLYSPAWMDYVAQSQLKGSISRSRDGLLHYVPNDPNGVPMTFADPNEAGRWLLSQTIDFPTMAKHLRLSEGMILKRLSSNGDLAVFRNGNVVATANDLETLIQQHPELLPKIPSYLGPKAMLVDDNTVQMVYNRGVAIGSYDSLLRHASTFKSAKDVTRIKLGSGEGAYVVFDPMQVANRYVTLHMPEIGVVQKFKSWRAAKNFVTQGWQEYENLKGIAMRKGYRLATMGGKLVLYGENGASTSAATPDGLRAALKAVTMPDWAPELTALEEAALEVLPKPPEGTYKPLDFGPPPIDPITGKGIIPTAKRLGQALSDFRFKISELYRPPDAYLVNAVKRGASPDVLRMFREIEATVQASEAESIPALKAIFTIFRHEGKYMARDRRILLTQYLRTPEADRAGFAQLHNMTQAELGKLDVIREYFNGMARKFNVPDDMFITDYLPRLYKKYLENPKMGTEIPAVQFIRDAYGKAPPRDLVAFFQHERIPNVLNLAQEEDPLVLMMKYNVAAHRSGILGPVWRRITEELKTVDVPPEVRARFGLFLNDVMGLPQGPGQRLLRQGARDFMTKLGLDPTSAKDIASAIMGWGYLASMGYRMWLPIRNSFQIYTTLGPRLDLQYVNRAMRDVAKDTKGVIFDRLRAKGIIRHELPLYGSELIDPTSLLGRLTSKGLKWYKNSDEFTRAVAYRASELRFNDAEAALKAGKITNEQFLRESGLHLMDKGIQNQAIGLISEGKWSSAQDLFSTIMVRETMFPYQAGFNPTSFRGVVGKLFGMFGQYPTYYVENIKRGLMNGDAMSRLAFAGKFLSVSMALYESFRALGINATNFQPWNPMAFSGGPYYTMMNQMLQLPGLMTGRYTARQAAANLLGVHTKGGKLTWNPVKGQLTSWLAPGSFAIKSIQKGIDALNQGDVQGFIAGVTSTPYKPSDLMP